MRVGNGVMKIAFWNLAKNNNSSQVIDLIKENDIDIALFAEYKKTNFEMVVSSLEQYKIVYGYGGTDKVILLSKSSIPISVRQEQTRYSIYLCKGESEKYIIAGVHLPANPVANSETRKNVIRDLVYDIGIAEKEEKTYNTIVVGDFNASPFDEELIQKDCLNAVLYKDLICQQEIVTLNNKKYRRFYNPHLSIISEQNKNYGSLYYSSGISTQYWYSYDQIIVRKPLVDQLSEIHYCRMISGKKLLNKVAPKSSISDHLPLIAKIQGGK